VGIPLLGLAPDKLHHSAVAFRAGKALSGFQYLSDVHTLAQNLPPADFYLNVCGDRYNIAVLIGAVMLKGKTSLLPPNTAPETLRTLAKQYAGDTPDSPAVCVVTDWPFDERFGVATQFTELLAPEFEGEIVNPSFPAEQIVGILFTSGSTGVPAPNPRQWGSLCDGVIAEAQALALPALMKAGATQGISIVGTVPAQHSYGLESTLALAMQNGYAFSADASFFPADIVRALNAIPRPRVLVTTPFHLRVLLDSTTDLPELDLVVSATAPLANQLAQRAEAAFNAPVKEIYGCTEAGQIAARTTTQGEKWTLFPRVVLTKNGDTVMAQEGHVGAPRQLNDVIDLVNERQFVLHGRTSDLIDVAGKRTSLSHLNFQLNSIEGIVDGLFVLPPASDVHGGVQRLTAYVVTALSAAEVLAQLRLRIDPVFLPRPLKIVAAIERNATGKVTQDLLQRIDRKPDADSA
jgi:acyl-coenzyme A synthetase/AMP-(fatty) acid ligase